MPNINIIDEILQKKLQLKVSIINEKLSGNA